MSGTNLGTAWIQIKPSMKGMTSSIRSELSGVGDAGGAEIGSKFSAGFAAKMGLISGIAQQAFAKISSMVSAQMDDAFYRVDTLERFPKVMEMMGYSADDAAKAIQKLREGVEEVPTSLADVVSLTQRLTTMTKDVDVASDWALAISDAMLITTGDVNEAARGMQQFLQVLSKGKPVGNDWNTILEVANPIMEELAHSLGYTTAALEGDFYTALQKGTLSTQEMMDALLKLDKEGSASMESLSELAKASTGGIKTEFKLLEQTVSNLMVAVLQGTDVEPYIESISNRMGKLAPILIKGIGLTFIGVARAIPGAISPVINAIVELLPQFIDGIVTLFNAIVVALPQLINTIVAAIPTLVNSLVVALTAPNNLLMILQGFTQLVLASVQAFPVLLTALAEALPTIIENIVTFLTMPETIAMVMDAAVQLFMGIVLAIPQIIGSIFSAFGQLFGKLWDFLTSKFGEFAANFGNFLGNIFKNAINAVIAFIENFINGPIDIINGFLGIINDAFGWLGVHIDPIARIQLPRLATGGLVEGIGTSTSDSNLYALSKGEYVIRAAAARDIGYENLARMNETGEISGGQTINFTINGYNKSPEELANIISRKIAFNQRGVIG